MGFHVGWITVRGKAPAQVQAELRLAETGAREYVPESDLTAVLLPSEWYVVFCNDLAAPELEDDALTTLSRGADVMAFLVEEASMVSVARGFSGGNLVWTVVHDASEGLDNLLATGRLPLSFASIRDRLSAELDAAGPNAADYLFDVPAELCKSITGFRHDEDIEGIEDDAFTVLERT